MSEPSACLSCGADLEIGVIVGQQRFLNWEPHGAKGGPTMHGKEHPAKGSLGSGPRLHAARCRECGLGYFQSAPATLRGGDRRRSGPASPHTCSTERQGGSPLDVTVHQMSLFQSCGSGARISLTPLGTPHPSWSGTSALRGSTETCAAVPKHRGARSNSALSSSAGRAPVRYANLFGSTTRVLRVTAQRSAPLTAAQSACEGSMPTPTATGGCDPTRCRRCRR